MIKRDIIETIYEYDNEGKLIKKTVTETHESEDNTSADTCSLSSKDYPNTYTKITG